MSTVDGSGLCMTLKNNRYTVVNMYSTVYTIHTLPNVHVLMQYISFAYWYKLHFCFSKCFYRHIDA